MTDLKGKQNDFAARAADSNGTFPFGNIDANSGDSGIDHKQPPGEKSIEVRPGSLPIQLAWLHECPEDSDGFNLHQSNAAMRGRMTVCAVEREVHAGHRQSDCPPIVA